MPITQIGEEFEKNGRLSRRAVEELRQLILSDDPYGAITLAADTGCVELAPEIACNLLASDAMVRWNAAAALFTRFRLKDHIYQCFEMAKNDPEELVRAIALVGLGELMVLIKESCCNRRYGHFLLKVFNDETLPPPLRSSAYAGILAALDVLPTDRLPANRLPDFSKDIDPAMINNFKELYIT